MAFTRNGNITEALKIGTHASLSSDLKKEINERYGNSFPAGYQIKTITDKGGGNNNVFLIWIPDQKAIIIDVSEETWQSKSGTMMANSMVFKNLIDQNRWRIKEIFKDLGCKMHNVCFYKTKKQMQQFGYNDGFLVKINYAKIKK